MKIMLQDFMLEYLQPLALQRLDADTQSCNVSSLRSISNAFVTDFQPSGLSNSCCNRSRNAAVNLAGHVASIWPTPMRSIR